MKNKYKFKINEEGYYVGYGIDGTISFDQTYNLQNLPTEAHYRKGGKWVKNTKKANEIFNKEIYAKLDANRIAIAYNHDRYGHQPQYAESYEAKKAELVAEQADLISQLK